MELRGLAAAVVALALAPDRARAQTAAEPAEADPAGKPQTLASDVRPRHPQGPAQVGIGARIGGGSVYADGVPNGWLFRIDYEAFLHIAPRGTVGGLFGFLIGFDYWSSGVDNWGLAMPTAFVIGMRAVAVRGLVGVGINAAGVDQVADDTGFVFGAPLAVANLGLDVHGFTVMADARVSRRWQIGADDHTQWMLSVMVGATLEPKYNRRFFEGPAPGQRR